MVPHEFAGEHDVRAPAWIDHAAVISHDFYDRVGRGGRKVHVTPPPPGSPWHGRR